jgi:deoxyribose-phosphate aldolase
MTKEELAAMIDHTLLKPAASEHDIKKLCAEAREYRFWSVCVNSAWVSCAKHLLTGSGVKVCAVTGFPLGAMSTEAKAEETRIAVKDGADEIDMVINLGFLKSGKADAVQENIGAVKRACNGRLLKVILETCLLTEEEKVLACGLAQKAGADFVKTSTGFSRWNDRSRCKVDEQKYPRYYGGQGFGRGKNLQRCGENDLRRGNPYR